MIKPRIFERFYIFHTKNGIWMKICLKFVKDLLLLLRDNIVYNKLLNDSVELLSYINKYSIK